MMRDVPLFATFVPSKIFEYLAAGRPVVGAVTGEPAAILRAAGAVVVAPEDPAALAEAIDAETDTERLAHEILRERGALLNDDRADLMSEGERPWQRLRPMPL